MGPRRMGPFVRVNAVRSAVIGAAFGGLSDVPKYTDLTGYIPEAWSCPQRKHPPSGIVLHHTTNEAKPRGMREMLDLLQRISKEHADRFGCGPSYAYVVFNDGSIFKCHDVDTYTSHVQGANTDNTGVALVGNFQEGPVPAAQASAARSLVLFLMEVHGIERVKPHRAFKPTACPGKYAVEEFKDLWAP